MTLHPDVIQNTLNVMKPIRFILVCGKTNGTAAMPTRGLASLLLQPLIQPDTVLMDLGHIKVTDEIPD